MGAVVVKVIKKKPHASGADWQTDVHESVTAQWYANKFAERQKLNKPFKFAIPKVFKITRDCSGGKFRKSDRVLVEPKLPGKWLKWNNNLDYVNVNAPGTNRGRVVQAFSHYTYHKSNGERILVDIQGTHGENGGEYLFTDPAFNTKKGGTSDTDRGQAGIRAFFSNYKRHWPCSSNKFCKAHWKMP